MYNPTSRGRCTRTHAAQVLADLVDSLGIGYRVLRPLWAPDQLLQSGDAPTRRMLLVDAEATGLNAATAELLELAVLTLDLDDSFRIVGVGELETFLQEPSQPLDPAIEQLTGLTEDALAGHSIDVERVTEIASCCHLVVAHNAGYDRPLLERYVPAFAELQWACSMADIDWRARDLEGRALHHLVMQAGYTYKAHRAASDVQALANLLASPAHAGEHGAINELFDAAAHMTVQVEAYGVPFHLKDEVKVRGYRWNPQQKCWWTSVGQEFASDELAFLAGLHSEVWVNRTYMSALDRYRGCL